MCIKINRKQTKYVFIGEYVLLTHKCERNSGQYKINEEKMEINLKSSDVYELFKQLFFSYLFLFAL